MKEVGSMEMPEVIRSRRTELGLSQADLAVRAGVDKRQIRRYEAGEAQPALSVAAAIARALAISLDELAGEPSRQINLSGDWWACWQAWKDGVQYLRPQPVALRQRRDTLEIAALERGVDLEQGGYLWQGELRLWDSEILMGWYAANDGAVRSKGTLYYVLHQHGLLLTGRWVGLSYDGPIITGWATLATTEDGATTAMNQLLESDQNPR